MKKMILSAAIVAAMALGVSVNAQDTKEKKECTKTEQKCCKKEGKEACKKDKACDKKKDECCSKKKEAKWWSSHRSKELSQYETTLFFYFFVSGPLDILSLERMARGRSAMRMQVCWHALRAANKSAILSCIYYLFSAECAILTQSIRWYAFCVLSDEVDSADTVTTISKKVGNHK